VPLEGPTVEDIKKILGARKEARIPSDGLKPAAVLVPIFLWEEKWHVLLTRRSQKVEHHKGEISFPGGHVDDDDENNCSAALREAEEEVGVPPDKVEILGRLDDIVTITGFRVRPFVGRIEYPYQFVASDDEIEEIILLPLSGFVEPDRCVKSVHDRGGESYPIYFFKVEGYTVWGATAKILVQLLKLILGFEEPC